MTGSKAMGQCGRVSFRQQVHREEILLLRLDASRKRPLRGSTILKESKKEGAPNELDLEILRGDLVTWMLHIRMSTRDNLR